MMLQRLRSGGAPGVRARARLALVILAAGLCACASAAHRQVVPQALPEAFAASGQAPAGERWWKAMGDTTLSRLIDEALVGNPTIRMAYARLEQAEAAARRDRAGLFPTVDLQGSASRIEQSDNGPTRRDFTNLSAGAAASYEIDLWGRLGSLSEAAALDREASREDLKTAAITLSSQVASTWYQLVEQRAQLQVLAAQRELNEQTLELVTLRFRRGQVGATDVLRQRQLVESTRGETALTQSRQAVLEHGLAILLGRPPGDSVAPHSGAGFLPLPPLPETGLPADLVRRRPDIVRAYLALLAADQRAAAAVAARFPRLSLSGQASTSGEGAGDLFHNWLTSLAANLALPLLDAGQRRAEAERSQAMAAERLHAYEQTVLAAMGEVEGGLAQEHRQRQYLDSVRKQLGLSQNVIDRTRDSYTSGAIPYLQVLDALRTHQQLERAALAAERQLISMRIDLYRVLAGGWEMPTASAAPPEQKRR